MKIAFFGTNSPFSRIILKAVWEVHELVAIIESPSAINQRLGNSILIPVRKLRSFFYTPHSLQRIGEENSIPYYILQGKHQSELADFIKRVKPDIICSSLFNRLIEPEVFNIPEYGAVNIHPALLPAYPGPNPLFWQYYFMDLDGGITIHFIDKGEDTGDIIAQQKIAMSLGMDSKEYGEMLINTAVPLLLKALSDIESGIVTRRSQANHQKFRARRVNKKEDLIDWESWPIERIWHLARGFEKRYELFPRPKYLPGFYWKEIGSFEKKPGHTKALPKIRFDSGGFYLAHWQGKIRLKPSFSIRKFLSKLL